MYDENSAAYAEHSARNPWNELYDRPAMLSLAGDVSGKRVLDVGCAAGHLSAQLAARGASVVGMDLSAGLVEFARAVHPDVTFVCGDLAGPLEFADASFGLVTASLVLHYLEDWAAPLAELRRVLVPGGAVVLSVHHPCEDWRWGGLEDYFATVRMTDRWTLGGEVVEVEYFHRPLSAVFSSVLEAGFRVDEVVEPMPLPECESVDPRAWASLTTKPRFLYLRMSR